MARFHPTLLILALVLNGCSTLTRMPSFPSAVSTSDRVWQKHYDESFGVWVAPADIQKLGLQEFWTAVYGHAGLTHNGAHSFVWIMAYRMASPGSAAKLLRIIPKEHDRSLFNHANICVVCDANEAGEDKAFCARLKSIWLDPKP